MQWCVARVEDPTTRGWNKMFQPATVLNNQPESGTWMQNPRALRKESGNGPGVAAPVGASDLVEVLGVVSVSVSRPAAQRNLGQRHSAGGGNGIGNGASTGGGWWEGPRKGAQGGGSGEPGEGARWGQDYPRGGVAGNFRNPKTRVLGGRGASTHREGGRAEIKGELNKSQWPF